MEKRNLLLSGIIIFCLSTMVVPKGETQVQLGLENLLENYLHLIEDKRLGIIANHTSLDSGGKHITRLLSQHAEIKAIFGPEHGFQGNVEDGADIQDTFLKDIPIYSLYGEFRGPTLKMLENVDVLIYDIQDVGVKFYTYISNLFLAMNSAKQKNIPIIVLDKPNPINATRVEGAITNPMFCSFVGVIPLPMQYGMTVGELAQLFNQESYGGFFLDAQLTVIPMEGYQRDMWYDETGLPWTPTSPNMPTLETAIIYPGTCLIEGTNLSEGRGTKAPFLIIGAPYINSGQWFKAIPKEVMTGIEIEPVTFTPKRIEGKVNNPKYKDQQCQGLQFHITNREQFRPIEFTVALLCAAQRLYPDQFKMRRYLDQLWGNENLRSMISEGHDYQTILKTTYSGVERFKKVREKYLLY